MPMTREEFDRLVRCVDEGVGRHPGKLRRRVAFLAVAGYAGFLACFLVVLLLAAFCFRFTIGVSWDDAIFPAIAGLFILIGGGIAVGRALWVRLTPPKGRLVTATEAPQLHKLLDGLQAELHSAPFHQVLVDDECNAGVVQIPRLGVLGWPRNYLLLGLPLMECVSPEEFRAVLAHEFAHLSREHGRFGQWIYRLRRTWERVFESLSRPRVQGEVSLRPVIVKFINWFWPRFNAHAFVLSRANEYEADRVAGQLAGERHMASALLRIAFHSRQINDKFWPDLWLSANREAAPPDGVFLRLRDSLRAAPASDDGPKWVEEAFRLTTTNADTHPCLTDRLRALDVLPDGLNEGRFPAPPVAAPESAAEAMFGSALAGIRTDVEGNWRSEAAENWRNKHAKATALNHRLATLANAVPDPGRDADALWDKARALLELEGDKPTEPLLRQILELRPTHVAANYHLGRALLDEGNADGEKYLERAVAEQDELVPQACGVLRVHYRRTGQTQRLRELEARLDRYEAAVDASHAERSSVTASDPLISHGLSDTELAELVSQVSADADVFRAELVRKELKHFPQQRLFLLCVRARRAWHRLPRTELEQSMVNRLMKSVRLPGRVLIFSPSSDHGALARKIAARPDAMIFQRPG